jgi:cytochrome c553
VTARAGSWLLLVALALTAFALGFTVVGRFQLDAPTLGAWAALCRGLGLTADVAAAAEPQPPARVPTLVAWTPGTLAQVAAGDATRGAFIAMNCAACHGAEGISTSNLIPTLAGVDAAATYKQLADYRSGNRSWGVMNAIAKALSAGDSADVAAYFASRAQGLPAVTGLDVPAAGRSLRQSDLATRLVFAGDPARGIAPCAVCHGPSGYKIGAPALRDQRTAYIERQTAAFAEGGRQNDIDEQMRTIAAGLTPEEIHATAEWYGRQ